MTSKYLFLHYKFMGCSIMAEIVLEEFEKKLKLLKVVAIYLVAVMVIVWQGFSVVTNAFMMASDC